MKTARQMLEMASKQVTVMFRITGEILPMYHAVKRNGDEMVIAVDWPATSREKDMVIARVIQTFRDNDVVSYVQFGEAWSAVVYPGEDMEMIAARGVSNHPKRVEVVAFTAEDKTSTTTLTAHRRIVRPPGKKPYLGPLEMSGLQIPEGRFVGLLPRGGVQ